MNFDFWLQKYKKNCICQKKTLNLHANYEILTKKMKISMASTHQAGALYNSLTAGSKIIGTVVTDSDFRIDGIIEGDIHCKGRVVLGDHGIIKGDLTCQNADIMGTINGSLHVENTLSLRASGSITGDVKTKVLVIEPKAQFNGSCSMAQEAQQTGNNDKKEKKASDKKQETPKAETPKVEVPKVEPKTLAEKKREEIKIENDDVIAVFDEPEIIVEA